MNVSLPRLPNQLMEHILLPKLGTVQKPRVSRYRGEQTPKIKRDKLPKPEGVFKGRGGSPGSTLKPVVWLCTPSPGSFPASAHEVPHFTPTVPSHTNSDFFKTSHLILENPIPRSVLFPEIPVVTPSGQRPPRYPRSPQRCCLCGYLGQGEGE